MALLAKVNPTQQKQTFTSKPNKHKQ